jgi:hypothetical protein
VNEFSSLSWFSAWNFSDVGEFLQNHPGGLSNAQLTQAPPSTSIASGPPLPPHLPLHPYAQAALPLGYASMIGYPSLPQSYAYLPPAAFQQPYMNSGLFHQATAAVPNSNMKYPLPQYKSNIALASLPQLSNYSGALGTANNMPGNFNLNQSTASATAPLGFDGTVPSQYKDGNQFISLQQVPSWVYPTCIRHRQTVRLITNLSFIADRVKTLRCGCMELVREQCPHLPLMLCMAIKDRVIRPVFGRASYLHSSALHLGSRSKAWVLNTGTPVIIT